jgi:hypothetical protein
MTTSLLRATTVKDQRLSWRIFYALALGVIVFSCKPSAEAVSEDDGGHPALLLGGSFERPPVHAFLPGSKRTIVYPALFRNDGTCTPLATAAGMSPAGWDRFLKEAQERSLLLLATLDPSLIRDSSGVIQMAVIVSDDPRTASCILSPAFLKRFSAIFGPELLVAIPARNRIYVFPKLANRLEAMTETIRDDHLITPMPVSTELFEISKKGLRAVGSYDPHD